MRHIYFNQELQVVTVAHQATDNLGVLVGTLSEQAYDATHRTFLIQSLLTRAKLPADGITIREMTALPPE